MNGSEESKSNMFRISSAFAILFLLLLPLFFINIDEFYDWGDDFAHYLLQAKYFTGQLNELPVYCIESYSPLFKGTMFSIMLSPIYLFGGNDIILAKYLVCTFSFITGIFIFKFCAFYFDKWSSLLCALVVSYNFILVALKNQILPDSFFVGILFLGLVVYYLKFRYKFITLALISLALILIKPAGLVFTIAIIFDSIFKVFKKSTNTSQLLRFIVTFSLGLLILVVTFGPYPTISSISWYYDKLTVLIDYQSISNKIRLYWYAFLTFYDSDIPFYLNKLIKGSAALLIFTGIIVSFKRNPLTFWIVIMYLIVLLMYPYDKDPVRLFSILYPFTVILLLHGIWYYSYHLFRIRARIFTIPFFLILIMANIPNLLISAKGLRNTTGPFDADANQLFNFINSRADENDRIICNKPWLFAYKTKALCRPLGVKRGAQDCESDYYIFNLNESPADIQGQEVFRNNSFCVKDLRIAKTY